MATLKCVVNTVSAPYETEPHARLIAASLEEEEEEEEEEEGICVFKVWRCFRVSPTSKSKNRLSIWHR